MKIILQQVQEVIEREFGLKKGVKLYSPNVNLDTLQLNPHFVGTYEHPMLYLLPIPFKDFFCDSKEHPATAEDFLNVASREVFYTTQEEADADALGQLVRVGERRNARRKEMLENLNRKINRKHKTAGETL